MKQTRLMKIWRSERSALCALSTAFAQTTTKETTTTHDRGHDGVSGTTTQHAARARSMARARSPLTRRASDYDQRAHECERSAGEVLLRARPRPWLIRPASQSTCRCCVPDMPVRYTYVKEGDRMVVSKITVQKPLAEIRRKRRRLRPRRRIPKDSLAR